MTSAGRVASTQLCKLCHTSAGRFFHMLVPLLRIIKINIHLDCEIEAVVVTHFCKLRVTVICSLTSSADV